MNLYFMCLLVTVAHIGAYFGMLQWKSAYKPSWEWWDYPMSYVISLFICYFICGLVALALLPFVLLFERI